MTAPKSFDHQLGLSVTIEDGVQVSELARRVIAAISNTFSFILISGATLPSRQILISALSNAAFHLTPLGWSCASPLECDVMLSVCRNRPVGSENRARSALLLVIEEIDRLENEQIAKVTAEIISLAEANKNIAAAVLLVPPAFLTRLSQPGLSNLTDKLAARLITTLRDPNALDETAKIETPATEGAETPANAEPAWEDSDTHWLGQDPIDQLTRSDELRGEAKSTEAVLHQWVRAQNASSAKAGSVWKWFRYHARRRALIAIGFVALTIGAAAVLRHYVRSLEPVESTVQVPRDAIGPTLIELARYVGQTELARRLGQPIASPVSEPAAPPRATEPAVNPPANPPAPAVPKAVPPSIPTQNIGTVPSRAPLPSANQIPPTSEQPASPQRPKPTLSAGEIAASIARGDYFLANGDVVSARLFYERAAEVGDATAALRLGETFDQAFLDRARIHGVRGDVAAATRWYRRALELGAKEAEALLEAIANRQIQ